MARRDVYRDRLQPRQILVGSVVRTENDLHCPGMRGKRKGRRSMSGVVELDDVRPKRAGPILNRDFDVLIRLEIFDPGCIERMMKRNSPSCPLRPAAVRAMTVPPIWTGRIPRGIRGLTNFLINRCAMDCQDVRKSSQSVLSCVVNQNAEPAPSRLQK
jgi:hypothetical protein